MEIYWCQEIVQWTLCIVLISRGVRLHYCTRVEWAVVRVLATLNLHLTATPCALLKLAKERMLHFQAINNLSLWNCTLNLELKWWFYADLLCKRLIIIIDLRIPIHHKVIRIKQLQKNFTGLIVLRSFWVHFCVAVYLVYLADWRMLIQNILMKKVRLCWNQAPGFSKEFLDKLHSRSLKNDIKF